MSIGGMADPIAQVTLAHPLSARMAGDVGIEPAEYPVGTVLTLPVWGATLLAEAGYLAVAPGVAGPIGHDHALGELGDVDTTGAADGHALVYQAGTWGPGAGGGGAGGPHSSTHASTGADAIAPADIGAADAGHTHAGLTADAAGTTASLRSLGTLSNQAAAGDHGHSGDFADAGHTHTADAVGAASAAHAHSLDELSDVATTGATDGQSLVYQAGSWGPATVSGGAGGGVTDHGALTGLNPDDDHPQYALADGTRGAFAAPTHTHTQVQSHNSPDTDTATTALHHTLGAGANQAAAGNHAHTAYAPATLTTNTRTAAYTLALGDAGAVVEMNTTGAATVTVPANSTAAFAVGTTLIVRQYGAGQTSIAAAAGVTIRSRGGLLNLAGQYAEATLTKRAADEWVLSGDLA